MGLDYVFDLPELGPEVTLVTRDWASTHFEDLEDPSIGGRRV